MLTTMAVCIHREAENSVSSKRTAAPLMSQSGD
jgi:hypothetical protein